MPFTRYYFPGGDAPPTTIHKYYVFMYSVDSHREYDVTFQVSLPTLSVCGSEQANICQTEIKLRQLQLPKDTLLDPICMSPRYVITRTFLSNWIEVP